MDQDCLPTAYRKNMLKVARRRACPLVESGYWDRENVVTRPGPRAEVQQLLRPCAITVVASDFGFEVLQTFRDTAARSSKRTAISSPASSWQK